MDSDDDDDGSSSANVENVTRATNVTNVTNVTVSPGIDSASHMTGAKGKKKALARQYPTKRPHRRMGDSGEYMREQEAERQYFFDTAYRLSKKRLPGDTAPLHIPPWTWSENARLFKQR